MSPDPLLAGGVWIRDFPLLHSYAIALSQSSLTSLLSSSPPSWRILKFLEKPHPHETTSRSASPVFYCFNRDTLSLVTTYNQKQADKTRKAFGHFMVRIVLQRAMPSFVDIDQSKDCVCCLRVMLSCYVFAASYLSQYITVYHCSILQYTTVYHSILQYTAVYHSILQYTAVYCSIS